MNSKLQNAAVRFLPSLTDVAFIVPLIFQFNQLGGAPSLLQDGDTGWHLRTGEWILANGRVPQQDMFSYTHAGQPWYAWEWLWDVSFGFVNQHFGLAAVVALSMLLVCMTSAMLYRLVLRKCPNPLIAIVITVLAAAGASIHWLARPHLFTLFFVVVFLRILDDAYVAATVQPDAGSNVPAQAVWSKKLLVWLPLLMVLWTNLHGGFVAGLILIGGYVGGGLIAALLEPDATAKQAILARVKPFFLSGVLCALATLVNPYFVGLHIHIFNYLRDPYLYEHIKEFMAFNFGHPASKYIETLMLLGAATAVWNLYHRRFEYFVLLCGWLHLGLNVRRNIPLFSLVCAPFVAEAIFCWLRDLQAGKTAAWLQSLVKRFEETAANIGETDRLPRFHVASIGAMVLLAAILYAPQPPDMFQATQSPKDFPVAAVKMLLHDGDSRIFTCDYWGGYLIYRMYPQAKVFIDGRSDFYGDDFELKYLDVLSAKYDWDQTLDHFGAQTVLVPVEYALASALKENRRWRVVYDDKVAIVFRLVNASRPSQQVSSCPDRGAGENCGGKTAGAAIMGDPATSAADHSKPNFVAEISPPRLPLLNRP
jgi:hypothetical protein